LHQAPPRVNVGLTPGDVDHPRGRTGTVRSVTEADWFLTRDERGNPSTSIDRGGDPGLAWTTGNAVTPLLHGRSYFSRLAEELRTEHRGGEWSHATSSPWRPCG
jgi:hypothetical protein